MWQGDVRKQQELYNDRLMLQILIVPEQSCWIISYLETSITLDNLVHINSVIHYVLLYSIKIYLHHQQSQSSLVLLSSSSSELARLTNQGIG